MLEPAVLARMNDIFAECVLTDSREMTREDMTFFENHVSTFSEYILNKAIKTISEHLHDPEMVEMILHSIHRVSVLQGAFSFVEYSKFRSITEGEE